MTEDEGESVLPLLQKLPLEMRVEVFSKLDYNEVLRFRRINSEHKAVAGPCLSIILPKGYLQISMDSDHPRSLTAFKEMYLQLDFIPRKIEFFTDKTEIEERVLAWKDFLQNPELEWFQEACAPHVKYLLLDVIPLTNISKEELAFLESFKRLESFKCADGLWSYSTCQTTIPIPKPFQQLKQLVVVNMFQSPSGESATERSLGFYKWVNDIRATASLENFRTPFIEGHVSHEAFQVQRELVMALVQNGMTTNKRVNVDLTGFLQSSISAMTISFDESDFHGQTAPLKEMLTPVFQLCEEAGLKLEDVCTPLLIMIAEMRPLVKSMMILNPRDLLCYDYLRLEKVDIDIVSNTWFNDVDDDGTEKSWPVLREVRVYPTESSNIRSADVKFFIDRFLRRSQRPNLKSLSIDFTEKPELSVWVLAKDLCAPCPYLTYISLQGFQQGDNDFFLALWRHLPLLEHVCMFDCPNLADGGLIGNDPENPAICTLQNLRFLELGICGEYSGISDGFFRNAVCRLPLKGLRLASTTCDRKDYDFLLSSHAERFRNWFPWNDADGIKTVRSKIKRIQHVITLEELRALKTGVFAETIEMLDFSTLKLGVVEPDQIIQLQMEFRSSQF